MNIDFGRSELADHLVGYRRVTHVLGEWHPTGMTNINGGPLVGTIERAQHDYDRGVVEMCQARVTDGEGARWELLYAIPRKKKRDEFLNWFGTLKMDYTERRSRGIESRYAAA